MSTVRLGRVLRPLRTLAHAFALLGGLAAFLVAMLTVASIAGRVLAGTPISGDVELTQFGVALAISLCLPWAQLHGANIIVDFFTQKLRAPARRRLDAVGALLMAVFCGLLAWRTAAGAFSVAAAGETTMILGAPMWISYAVLAPGLALIALIALVQAIGLWQGTLEQPAHAAEVGMQVAK
ncbi:TRAP transporter small permease [Rivibacter subsaxonicus]|uniref:TRAP transporter small permease protein n=1 Tax=Rivibacter subsaxonicus TaxID=457575 RepID=A0A4V2FUL6_9BURK|nr:TRAP transporter small permease [Rivibacter subsaxonicus]RZU02476.1 TRAP-type C4-dicarboxylate transport system permease small subunit [Rivibacter subsaxonicus]